MIWKRGYVGKKQKQPLFRVLFCMGTENWPTSRRMCFTKQLNFSFFCLFFYFSSWCYSEDVFKDLPNWYQLSLLKLSIAAVSVINSCSWTWIRIEQGFNGRAVVINWFCFIGKCDRVRHLRKLTHWTSASRMLSFVSHFFFIIEEMETDWPGSERAKRRIGDKKAHYWIGRMRL